jgi:protein involved in polysaccharide export with SLBB domain
MIFMTIKKVKQAGYSTDKFVRKRMVFLLWVNFQKADFLRNSVTMYKAVTKNKRWMSCLFLTAALLLLSFCAGCGNKFFDPTAVGRFRTVPAVNVILDSLGVAEETPIAWEEGEEPKPIDTIPVKADYIFQSGDIIRVDIFELLGLGTRFVNDYVVTETGKISVPEAGVIEVAGLTETQLEEKLKKILSPNILKNPLVTVTLMSSQQRAFSIIGDGVLAPNRYIIPRYDFRLTDALAIASGTRQFNVSYIYVSRSVDNNGKKQPIGMLGSAYPELKTSAPSRQQQQTNLHYAQKQTQWPESKVVISSSEMIAAKDSGAANRFELFGNRRNWTDRGNVWQLSDMPSANSTNEPMSVQEVLKTLSERSGQKNGVNTGIDNGNTVDSNNLPAFPRQVNQQMNYNRSAQPSPGSVSVGQTNESQQTQGSGQVEWVYQNGKWVPVQVGQPQVATPTQVPQVPGHIEWIYQNGKWVPVQVGQPQPTEPTTPKQVPEQIIPPPEEVAAPNFGWAEQGAETRLIKIPTDKLLAGDPRYNIVIKPGDTIFVPVDIVGEFYIMGNVNRTGTIPLTGRPMTLKQAIAAAGGFAPLAWPKRCEVIRRIGRKKEEIVMVDLDKIYNGEQPDFFIKPHDLVNVGTHATARWRAILRNAFRATYGFGFVYDRNFADRDFYTHRPIPDWF